MPLKLRTMIIQRFKFVYFNVFFQPKTLDSLLTLVWNFDGLHLNLVMVAALSYGHSTMPLRMDNQTGIWEQLMSTTNMPCHRQLRIVRLCPRHAWRYRSCIPQNHSLHNTTMPNCKVAVLLSWMLERFHVERLSCTLLYSSSVTHVRWLLRTGGFYVRRVFAGRGD